jgi:hypothetical protein
MLEFITCGWLLATTVAGTQCRVPHASVVAELSRSGSAITYELRQANPGLRYPYPDSMRPFGECSRGTSFISTEMLACGYPKRRTDGDT